MRWLLAGYCGLALISISVAQNDILVIRQTPRFCGLKTGLSLTILCQYTPKSNQTVTWYKAAQYNETKEKIEEGKRTKFHEVMNDAGFLRINDLHMKDEGLYYCKINGTWGRGTAVQVVRKVARRQTLYRSKMKDVLIVLQGLPCTESNLKCGSIFCGGGGESITGKRASYTVYGIECKLAEDDDKTRNMDMVPKGTKCGPNKVCFDNRCVDLSVYGKTEDCAKKCNNNGVCNHKNECHCNPGWAPPYCDIQYADLPQGQNGIIAGVCAVLSILLVITVVIASLMCCKKDNMDNYTSKRKVHSAPDKLNPMFQEPNGKDRPQISQPTFMESTAAQACAPLIVTVTPSRPAPQPPKKLSSVASTSQTEPMKPQPPVKPLPPLNKTQYKAASPSVPPVPPVKPSPPPAARIKPCAPPPLPPAKPHVHRLA